MPEMPEVPVHSLHRINPQIVASSLRKFGGIRLKDALPKEIVLSAYAEQDQLLGNLPLLESMPYDRRTRLGYTPSGVEGLQRRPGSRSSRYCFDYHPSLQVECRNQEMIFGAAVLLCRTVLSMMDRHEGTKLGQLKEGTHILRMAQYQNDEEGPDIPLFGSHVDFGLLTAFIGTGVPGLQVEIKGVVHDAPLEVGEVLIGTGTPFVQFAPHYRALRHEVAGRTRRRLSSFLFYELDDDVLLPRTQERYRDFIDRILDDVLVAA